MFAIFVDHGQLQHAEIRAVRIGFHIARSEWLSRCA
jgi:hypothetical protein